MKANYHTHTWRCNHAEADERRYVETALHTGIKVLGFADHSPYPFDDGYCSGFRMRLDQTQGYVDTLCALRQEYQGEIDIHIGFEAEYYPKYFGRLLAFLEPMPYEYLMLGQHFGGNELGVPHSTAGTDSASVMQAYYDQCLEGLNTGAYSCWVHPDVFRFTGDEAVYRRIARAVCREAKGCGVPLEINLLGLGGGRHYPREAFWEEAAVVGSSVVLGWDAHQAAWMDQPALEQRGLDMIARLGLHRIDYLTLIRPHP